MRCLANIIIEELKRDGVNELGLDEIKRYVRIAIRCSGIEFTLDETIQIFNYVFDYLSLS